MVDIKPDTYSVVSTMRNEGPYIIDWVAHYKVLGFDQIIIASNNCTDLTDPILDRLQELGHIIHHYTVVRKAGFQRGAIRQCMTLYEAIESCQWHFICDADEYLNIHIGDGKVRDLVAAVPDPKDAIAVPWRVFGPNGIESFDDKPVTDQFQVGELPFDRESRPDVGKFTKSLVTNLEKYGRMGLHVPILDRERDNSDVYVRLPDGTRYFDDKGEYTSPDISFDIAQVNHYALKSLEGYLIKHIRGEAQHSDRIMGIGYWDKYNLDGEIDTSISRYAKDKAKIRKELLADKTLKDLHSQSVKWYKNKAQSILIDPENTEFIAQLRERNQGNLTS